MTYEEIAQRARENEDMILKCKRDQFEFEQRQAHQRVMIDLMMWQLGSVVMSGLNPNLYRPDKAKGEE